MNVRRGMSLVILPLLAAALAFPLMGQAPPPPAPTLTKVTPDRVAVGDLITLSGAHFIPAGTNAETYVNFGSMKIKVSPDGDGQISLVVPSGAASGAVTVMTVATVDGQALQQTSGPVDILVIWTSFDATRIHPLPWPDSSGFKALLGGQNDDIYAVYDVGQPSSPYYATAELWHILADGSSQLVLTWLNWRPPYAINSVDPRMVKRNPVTGEFWGVKWYTMSDAVVNLSTGAETPIAESQFILYDLDFDAQGNLYLLAGNLPGYNLGTWRFAPGETPHLDPATSLIGSLALTDVEPRFRVAPNGAAYIFNACVGDNYYGCYEALQVNPPGSPVATYSYPPAGRGDQFYDAYLAVDCMNRAYFTAAPEGGYACSQPLDALDGAGGKQTLVDPAAMGLSQVRGLAADGYGDLYILGNAQCTSASPWWAGTTIKRVQPSQMSDPHYFDTFTCCPTNVALRSMVQRDRGESVQLSCSTASVSISQGGQSTTVTKSGQTIMLPLGAMPNLALLSNGQIVSSVTWSLKNPARDTTTADPDDLFPNDVALLWSPIASPPPVGPPAPAQLVVIHLGSFQITATSGQNSLSFTVKTVATCALGLSHGDFDSTICANAERFGIPPEYIKGCISRESNFHPGLTRYEARTWDYSYFRRQLRAYP